MKANRPTLHEEIEWFFKDIDLETDTKEGLVDSYRSIDKDHGRIEVRECVCSEEIDWMKPYVKDWPKVRSIAMVKAKRTLVDRETRYDPMLWMK